MFAIFTQDTALPPVGLLGGNQRRDEERKAIQSEGNPFADRLGTAIKLKKANSAKLQRQSSDTLEAVHGGTKQSEKVDLGEGNGISFVKGPFCHHAHAKHIDCLFTGEVSQWPGLDLMAENHNAFVAGEEEQKRDEASWLVAFYKLFESQSKAGIIQAASNGTLEVLAKLEGKFAFVVYDKANGRVLAARDRAGLQEMYWGSTSDGCLMFSSNIADLASCNPTATAFPAGSLFVSESHARAMQPGINGWMIDHRIVPGELASFVPRKAPLPKPGVTQAAYRAVKAVPRVNSQGCLCGAVYRVASENSIIDWGASC